MKKTFIMTIETDDKNIAEKFPNWCWNFSTSEEFIKHIAKSKEEISYHYPNVEERKSMWKLFGYRVRVKELK